MPDEPKKNQQKPKHEAKEQRRRRQGRQPAPPAEKKPEKEPEAPKEPEKPAYKPPGPEFYNSLKRETDEILKITEEANTKYKKKEIQSNWAKYEMPIETYDEIDEQENMGADYEKLIQAPLSVGGHFQFKHEKSWDAETGPSLYDRFFDINMDQLSIAVSTIPFYERNNIDVSIFNDNDIFNMKHRATKFKQKYYNDKKYNTPEMESQEKILKSLISNDTETDQQIKKREHEKEISFEIDAKKVSEPLEISEGLTVGSKKPSDEPTKDPVVQSPSSPLKIIKAVEVQESNVRPDIAKVNAKANEGFDNDDDIFDDQISIKNMTSASTANSDVIAPNKESTVPKQTKTSINKDVIIVPSNEVTTSNKDDIMYNKYVESVPKMVESPKNEAISQATHKVKEEPKNPIIESPEDLEKWLDDFLDS